MINVFVQITPAINSHWKGLGRLVRADITSGLAFVEMLTGSEKGKVGGFSLDGMKLVVGTEEVTNYDKMLKRGPEELRERILKPFYAMSYEQAEDLYGSFSAVINTISALEDLND